MTAPPDGPPLSALFLLITPYRIDTIHTNFGLYPPLSYRLHPCNSVSSHQPPDATDSPTKSFSSYKRSISNCNLAGRHNKITIISAMGNSSSAPTPPPPTLKDNEPKGMSTQKVGIKSGKKICCCCPETKEARDACVLSNGEEDADCQRLIELHKECLRGEGFTVK